MHPDAALFIIFILCLTPDYILIKETESAASVNKFCTSIPSQISLW